MNNLRLCGGSAATTATLAMNRTFMWHSLRAAADDANRLLTGGWIAAVAQRSPREPASAASQGQVAGPRLGVGELIHASFGQSLRQLASSYGKGNSGSRSSPPTRGSLSMVGIAGRSA